jgi:hypothetical protein
VTEQRLADLALRAEADLIATGLDPDVSREFVANLLKP